MLSVISGHIIGKITFCNVSAFCNGLAQMYLLAPDMPASPVQKTSPTFIANDVVWVCEVVRVSSDRVIHPHDCLFGQFQVSPKFLERAVLRRRHRDTRSVLSCPSQTPVARLYKKDSPGGALTGPADPAPCVFGALPSQ